MSNLEAPTRRRGLWLLLVAWAVVLGLVGSAVGFVMFQRFGVGDDPQQVVAESSEADPDAANADEANPDAAEPAVVLETDDSGEEAEEAASESHSPAAEAAADAPGADASGHESEAEPDHADASEAAHEPSSETAASDHGTASEDAAEIAHAAPAETAASEPAASESADEAPEAPQAEAPEEAPHEADTAVPAQDEQADAPADGAHDEPADKKTSEDDHAADPAASQQAAVTDGVAPPWQRFAGQTKSEASDPRIAIVLTGLGLSAAATEAAIKQLPAAVTLSFSPYARRLNQWIALARVNGHEVMIDLPMEPVTFPEDDPGPHALLTFLDSKQNLRRLDWVLNRGNSFVGVAAVMGSRFAASEEDMTPVMSALMERGLMFLDNRASDRSVAEEIAARLGLPHAVNDRTLDAAQASRIAINSRLTEIERLAQEKGHSIAMAQPYPVTLERLRDWATEIQSRGYALVPITALAAEPAGG